jgi:hypothetical protein
MAVDIGLAAIGTRASIMSANVTWATEATVIIDHAATPRRASAHKRDHASLNDVQRILVYFRELARKTCPHQVLGDAVSTHLRLVESTRGALYVASRATAHSP